MRAGRDHTVPVSVAVKMDARTTVEATLARSRVAGCISAGPRVERDRPISGVFSYHVLTDGQTMPLTDGTRRLLTFFME